MKAFVGCSGYYYRSWKGVFYPADLPQSKWLEYYCEHFNTIEINASFYRFPTPKSLKQWYDKTPEGFVFTIKAPQVITHFKRFKETLETTQKFYNVSEEGLKEKLHCILFQLPPSLKYEGDNLQNILENLDTKYRNVIEFRNSSWWNEEVFKVLKKNNIIFCSSSFPKLPEEFVKTSDDGYIRFHGKEILYKSAYTKPELKHWIKEARKEKVKNLYAYFNNTWLTGAIENAQEMVKQLKAA